MELQRQVYLADDGGFINVALPPDSSVEELQKLLHESCGMPPAEQVLIDEQGVNLRAGKRLGSPRTEAAIFLFSLRLVTSAELPRRSVQMPVLSEVPSEDPGLSEAYLRRADEICECCRVSVREQQVMSRALAAARINLIGHTKFFRKRFSVFDEDLKATMTRYRDTLKSCDEHFALLQDVQVPSEIASEGNLLQMPPCQNLVQLQGYAATGLEQMDSRMIELRSTFVAFAGTVEEESGLGDIEIGRGHFTSIEAVLVELVAIREEQYAHRKALGECGGDEARASELMQQMAETDQRLWESMQQILAAKETLRKSAHSRMQAISELQTQLRNMGKTTTGYMDSLQSLERYFHDLAHVPHIAPSFTAALEEVQRRRAFKASFHTKVQNAMMELQSACEEEERKRETFWSTYGSHLPGSLVPGLTKKLHTQPRLELPDFDLDLPDLSASSAAIANDAPASSENDAPAASENDSEKLQTCVSSEEDERAPASAKDRGGDAVPAAQQEAAAAAVQGPSAQGEDAIATKDVESDRATQPSETSQGGKGPSAAIADAGTAAGVPAESAHEANSASLNEVRLNNAHLENQLGETMARLSDAEIELESRLETIHRLQSIVDPDCSIIDSDSLDDSALIDAVRRHALGCENLAKAKLELEHSQAQVEVWRQRSEARVTCYGFELNDLALFRQQHRDGCDGPVYEALNVECPDYYLQTSNLGEQPLGDCVLGRIIHKQKSTTTEECNPFGLPLGKDYYELSVTLNSS